MKKILFLLMALMSISSIGISQIDSNSVDRYRKYVNDFLNIGVDARGIAMSKSVLTSNLDATATYWNPSLLPMNDYKLGFSTMYAEYVGGLSKFNFLAFSRRLNNERSTLGFSFLRMGTDNIPNTLYLVDDDGGVDYNRVSYFAAGDHAYTVSFGHKLGKNDSAKVEKSFGANFKFISRSAGSFARGWGIGLDLAFTVKRPKSSFAIVVKDATTTFVNWDLSFTTEQIAILNSLGNIVPNKSNEIALPTIMLAYGKIFNITPKIDCRLETNIINTIDGRRNNALHLGNMAVDPNFGTEFSFGRRVFIRGGIGNFQEQSSLSNAWKTERTFSPSLGAGVLLGRFNIDYALSRMEQSSDKVPYSHFISLSVRLDGPSARGLRYDVPEKNEENIEDINRINIRK